MQYSVVSPDATIVASYTYARFGAEIDGKRGMLADVFEGGEIALGDPIELF